MQSMYFVKPFESNNFCIYLKIQLSLAVRGLAIRCVDYLRRIYCVMIYRSRSFPSTIRGLACFILVSKLATKIIQCIRSHY